MMSMEGFQHSKDLKSPLPNREIALNPNAAEFVPSSFKSSPKNATPTGPSNPDDPITSGKAMLDRSSSNISSNSDDEIHQYWLHQLPDDIIPDFSATEGNELGVVGGLSLSDLSIHDKIEATSFAISRENREFSNQQELPVHGGDNIKLFESRRYTGLDYPMQRSPTDFPNLSSNPWSKHLSNDYQIYGREGNHLLGDSNPDYLNNFYPNDRAVLNKTAFNHLNLLASAFPGFAIESLSDVFYANDCDLNSTIEILTQLELQVDGSFNENVNTNASSVPSLTAADFPALPTSETRNAFAEFGEENVQQSPNTYGPADKGNFDFFKNSPTGTLRGAPDFASAVRKLASQDSGHWKYDRNGSENVIVGSSRNSQLSSYNGHGKPMIMDKMRTAGTARAAPIWLETGDAVGNMYSESREEARELARLRNICFEQARQAYRTGNKAVAKELSEKGQLYNTKMKAAHEKARESIYRQRNPLAPSVQGYNRGNEPLIDLHGLHVSEAIHVLKHELTILRRTARTAGQLLQVMICVGTGHHTKGSRTPARLPVAVEQYLLAEGLQFSEPQPGLLRVVLY